MKKLITFCFTLLLILSGCGSGEKEEEVETNITSEVKPVIEEKTTYKSNLTVDKQETVNVKTYADGTAYETMVEVVLKNPLDNELIKDKSTLNNIINTEGDETYTNDGEYLYWTNSREDIHYQGYSDESLPISLNIHYYLNDKEVKASELAHASGHIKIRFDYNNNTKVITKIAGVNYSVKIPFVCLTMLYLPTDNFYNISSDDGEIIDMDDSTLIIGMGFPGLQDSLNLKNTDFTKNVDLKDYFEIEADTDDFELDYTATIVSNGLLKDLKDDDLKDVDEMLDEVADIDEQKADINQAKNDLNEAANEFDSAIDKLTAYVNNLNAYVKTMNENSLTVFGILANKMSELNRIIDPTLPAEYNYSFNVESDVNTYSTKKKTELAYYKNIIDTTEDETIKAAATAALEICNYYYAAIELSAYTSFDASSIKTSIKDGINELIEALDEFSDNIDELTEDVDSGLRETINRLKATSKVDKQYHNFSGIVEDKEGSVVFIIQSDEIK